MMFSRTLYSSLAIIGLGLHAGIQSTFADVNVSIQPPNQLVSIGADAAFTASVQANAGEVITGYIWRKSTTTTGLRFPIAGATNLTYTLSNVQLTNGAYYFFSVTYNSGASTGLTVTSPAATLTVSDPPRMTSQPLSATGAAGTNFSFYAAATGYSPLTYQWRLNGVNLTDDGRITGAATTNIIISLVAGADAGGYDLVVTNIYGAATSQVATLTVLTPPSIVSQPPNLTVLTGSNASFRVIAGGTTPISYQWRKEGTNLANNGRISGATFSRLSITGVSTNDTGNYSVTLSNLVGSITSATATLTVLEPPAITSPTNATGQQGVGFNYTTTATGTAPILFGAQGLPAGLSLDPASGLISGVPAVMGVYNIALFATNAALTSTSMVTITLTTGVPGITSSLLASGSQGQSFNYTILSSNNPAFYSASGLPPGVNLDPTSGIISGFPVVSGTFFATIGAFNPYGSDSELLTISLASSVPVITSALNAAGVENRTGFSYRIRASNTPTTFGAFGLPAGLSVNPTTGFITGTPTYGGTNSVTIWARNAWGTGSNTLQLAVTYAPIAGLAITDVAYAYSKPYLLDFTFSLRDDPDPAVGLAVVRPPEQLSVVCMEGDLQQQVGVPIGKETTYIVNRAISTKQLKTFFVLDYTYSMFINPGAIAAMQSEVEGLINQEPAFAQFGIYEFSADYVAPQLVTGFMSDKATLTQDIEGIQTNFVQGNYAGTRFYDAVYAALNQFGVQTNADEQRYLVVMSDGNDDSSVLTGSKAIPALPDFLVALANTNNVKLYCVGFGTDVNTNVLQQLASQTQGRYFPAATIADLSTQFALLLKDLNARYTLRWATLQRAHAFQPMFQVTVNGVTASYNTAMGTTNIIDNTVTPPTTNSMDITLVPDFNPATWAGNVQVGALSLKADADTNASLVTLGTTYVPRYVREIRVHYRPNYPCTPSLASTGPGDILNGWSMTTTNDGTGGWWLTMLSPNPTNATTSLPYGITGDLVNFQFQFQALPTGQQAFSLFDADNTVYSNLPPAGQSFVLSNTNFITAYGPTPPYGTPVPWLIAHGFTNNFPAAELSDPNGNGMMVWQDYVAGLNPLDPNSKFVIRPLLATQPGQPNQITFSTALGRTYRVETALSLDSWTTLQDYISGTGGDVTVVDTRNLSGVSSVYYRVLVSY
jgi:hypothetical protein